ncbi:hypothetical protein EXIGLDRAFT_128906 [Exidia glandulosa HHB12029]|uniref:F-box domain-containing protein n=1 Tax=Exidia glandulosa HHB12029 TaxID=1314781 RepID=A0A165G679_EXIGL|nr:hypothetical protein EXIGLDRAFT_128906 [Exidia glandulosa HHB12029]
MLSRCPNVRRLTVHEWLELDGPVDFSTYAPFIGITTFYLVTSADASRRLALRSFCQLLRLMPSLKHLSFRGDLFGTDASLDDIPSPDFQLESLARSDARGVQFANYEWLLANSSNSLHTFWVYGIFDEALVIPCMKGLRAVAPTLRTFYLFGEIKHRLVSELEACKSLEELSVEEILILPSVSRVLDPYTKLRRLTITVTSSSGVFLGDHPVLNFFTRRELQLLAEILAKPHMRFPDLRCCRSKRRGPAESTTPRWRRCVRCGQRARRVILPSTFHVSPRSRVILPPHAAARCFMTEVTEYESLPVLAFCDVRLGSVSRLCSFNSRSQCREHQI